MRTIIVLLLTTCVAPLAHADVFTVSGVDNPGRTASVLFNVATLDVDSTRVHVEITNNTAGAVTAFAFNIPSFIRNIESFVSAGGAASWSRVRNPNNVVTPQAPELGRFDFCAETAGTPAQCSTGGTVASRINAGETGIFDITFRDTFAGNITPADFLSLFSDQASVPTSFAVVFQRGSIADVGVPAAAVPEPSSVILLSSLLAGIMLVTRGRFK